MFEYGGLKIHWLGHDGFKIKNSRTVYIDPFKIRTTEPADIILITHEHFDHLDLDAVRKITSPNTTIIAPLICRNELSKVTCKELIVVKPGHKHNLSGVVVEALPAYNTNKFREPGRVFHPKEEGRTGYVVTLDNIRIYHTGDTDLIPEMSGIGVDIALVPVSGTYVMTAEEAVQAVARIKPKIAIPMHYGAIVGDKRDATKFSRMASCEVQLLEVE